MLRLVDGFDVTAGGDAATQMKYPETYDTFSQESGTTPAAGPPGSSSPLDKALFLFNTAFGQCTYARTFDPQPTWGISLDFQMSGSGAMYPAMEWFRLSQGAPPTGKSLVTLTTNTDRSMTVKFLALDGSTITSFNTGPFLTQGTFGYLQFKSTLGNPASFTLKFDGNLILTKTFAGLPPTVFADTVTPFRWEGFGPPGIVVDNLLIWDGQNTGDGFNDIATRKRVTTVIPSADVAGGNWASPRWPAPFYAIAVNPARAAGVAAPFSDFGYIDPLSGNAKYLCNMGTVPCYESIAAVVLNICAKVMLPVTVSPTIEALVRETTVNNLIGAFVLRYNIPSQGPGSPFHDLSGAFVGYLIYQAIAARSPQYDAAWAANELGPDIWIVQADPTYLNEHVSAMFLEVVTDVSGLPFNCGGGPQNYSY